VIAFAGALVLSWLMAAGFDRLPVGLRLMRAKAGGDDKPHSSGANA
jgi:hypothetical protein